MPRPAVSIQTTSIHEPYCYELVRRVAGSLEQSGIRCDISLARQTWDRPAPVLDALALVTGTVDRQTQEIPAVIRVPGFHGRIRLTTNKREEAQKAIRHLLDRGHRAIAFFGRDGNLLGDGFREQAFLRQVPRAVHTGVFHCTAEPDDVRVTSRHIVAGGFTGVICTSDFLAMSLLHEASLLGRPVLDDLSVIGFSDIPEAGTTIPSLTTIRLPYSRLSNAVVQIVADILATGTSRIGNLSFRPELIIRRSTGLVVPGNAGRHAEERQA